MEIRELARQILEGTTLEDKLRAPEVLTDADPGPPRQVPAPGRPPGLALRDARPKVPFPSEAHLDRPEARGVVLHFFANHELLALELMALALLRFPHADPAFRRGLCAILREEQQHLRLYLDRMASSGVSFGDVPVSAFFWDCLAAAETPAAFVAGLSLTFEQANLDFAAHYAKAFRAVGDEDTASVLDQVLADEIGHVRHGLHWFDRWRRPGELWETWFSALPGPLTPARAKGIGFVREPRLAAGLDERTIDRLEVYSASRGRRPVLHRFDPDVESELAGAPSPAGAVVAEDLELVMVALAGRDDALWVRRPPRVAFLRSLQAAGFELPELVEELDDRPWGGVRPWAVSPSVCAALEPAGGPAWDPAWARFFSKAWAAGLPWPERSFVAPPEDRPVACASVAEVRDALERLAGRPFVIKAPWSTAGRDRRRKLDMAWVEGVLQRQGAVVVEPWLEKVADLSFQCRDGVLEGWGRFFTDRRGVYRGTWLGRPVDGLPVEVVRFVYGDGRDPDRLPSVFREVAATVGQAMAGFPAPAGVDALLYRRPDGALALQSRVEVNPRITMGRIALALARRVQPGIPARFDIVPKDRVRPRVPTLERGLLVDGVVPLTDPEVARWRVAVLSVGSGVKPDTT